MKFKVGDVVTYRVHDCHEYDYPVPIWDHDQNHLDDCCIDSISWLEKGTVTVVDEFEIFVGSNKSECTWIWPLEGSELYSPDQWEREGYLMKLESQPQQPEQHLCHCERSIVVNHGCQCGGL